MGYSETVQFIIDNARVNNKVADPYTDYPESYINDLYNLLYPIGFNIVIGAICETYICEKNQDTYAILKMLFIKNLKFLNSDVIDQLMEVFYRAEEYDLIKFAKDNRYNIDKIKIKAKKDNNAKFFLEVDDRIKDFIDTLTKSDIKFMIPVLFKKLESM